MKKVLSILCCIVLLFCVAACGKEPEPAAEPSTESIPVSSNTLISTEPQKLLGYARAAFLCGDL